MALYITKGFHSFMSVAAITDEGGFFRDVILRGQISAPYGRITAAGAQGCVGLPLPSRDGGDGGC